MKKLYLVFWAGFAGLLLLWAPGFDGLAVAQTATPTATQTMTPTPTPTCPSGSRSFPGPFTWEEVMAADQAWEHGGIRHPWILYEAPLYRMWYTPNNALTFSVTDGRRLRGGVAYAESLDGVNWTNKQQLIGTNMSPTGEQSIFRPSVIKSGTDEYLMYTTQFYEWYASEWSTFITVRSSTDGIHWGPSTVVLDDTGAPGWEVYRWYQSGAWDNGSGGILLFYDAMFNMLWDPYPHSYMALAESSDGINFATRSQLIGTDSLPFYVSPGNHFSTFFRDSMGTFCWLHADPCGNVVIHSSTDGRHWDKSGNGRGGVAGWANVIQGASASDIAFGCYVQTPAGDEYVYLTAGYSNNTSIIGRIYLQEYSDVDQWRQY